MTTMITSIINRYRNRYAVKGVQGWWGTRWHCRSTDDAGKEICK